jgi:hypothetical protein
MPKSGYEVFGIWKETEGNRLEHRADAHVSAGVSLGAWIISRFFSGPR